jgi:hypothetical protein
MEKLRQLPPVQHQVQSVEVQPSVSQNAIIVLCTGAVLVRASIFIITPQTGRARQTFEVLRDVSTRRIRTGELLSTQRHLPLQLRLKNISKKQ